MFADFGRQSLKFFRKFSIFIVIFTNTHQTKLIHSIQIQLADSANRNSWNFLLFQIFKSSTIATNQCHCHFLIKFSDFSRGFAKEVDLVAINNFNFNSINKFTIRIILGIQTTEEILRDGNIITAIGQIELDGGDLKLQESAVGPMFLTTATKSLLIRRFEQARNGMLYVLQIPLICCYKTGRFLSFWNSPFFHFHSNR